MENVKNEERILIIARCGGLNEDQLTSVAKYIAGAIKGKDEYYLQPAVISSSKNRRSADIVAGELGVLAFGYRGSLWREDLDYNENFVSIGKKICQDFFRVVVVADDEDVTKIPMLLNWGNGMFNNLKNIEDGEIIILHQEKGRTTYVISADVLGKRLKEIS